MKDIPWFNLYQINNTWTVRNKKTWKLLKSWPNNRWYIKYSLSLNWKQCNMFAHRLVMIAFKWESSQTVNHMNWIKDDNRLMNLEYCSHKENVQHARRTWLAKASKNNNFITNNPAKKRKVQQYSLNWDLIKIWDSIVWAQRETWANKIWECCNYKKKTNGGFVWRYSY